MWEGSTLLAALLPLLLAGPNASASDAVLVQGTAQVASPAPRVKTAGSADDLFFLRSPDGSFVLIPSGRLEYDFYAFEGGARQPPDGFAPKRVRLETFGNFLQRYDFQIGAEYTANAPVVADAYVSTELVRDRGVNLQIGQFDAPFTMDNRTSDKFFDLQERSVVVRAFAFPENKENGAMLWGQPPGKWAWCGVGAFNGEGFGQGLPHRDKGFVAIGRAWVAPFGLAGSELLKNVAVGGSLLDGNPLPLAANQLPFSPLKTVGGFTFLSAANLGVTGQTGLYGWERRIGGELNAPIGPFVLKAEAVHVAEEMRELTTVAPITETRRSLLVGDGEYVRLSWFAWGDPLINGLGGMENPPRLGDLRPDKTADALQFVVEADRVRLNYVYANPSAPNTTVPAGVDVLTAGVNYWQTKHVHWTANVAEYDFLERSVSPLVTSRHAYEATARITLAL